MGRINIDGRVFTGDSIIIKGNGKVIIDGVVQDGELTGVVEVRIVEGTVGNLSSEMSVHAGNVAGSVRAGMSVTCGTVGGDVVSSMSVTCGDVHGNIDAGMTVTCTGRR